MERNKAHNTVHGGTLLSRKLLFVNDGFGKVKLGDDDRVNESWLTFFKAEVTTCKNNKINHDACSERVIILCYFF